MESEPARKRRLSDDGSSGGPHHVAGQRFLNKLILTKISTTLNQDPSADLTVLLSDVSASYPSKRRKATETRTSARKDRVADSAGKDEMPIIMPPPPNLEVLYPIAPAALAAMGLSDGSSETEIESALIQLPQTFSRGEILHNLCGRQIIALDSNVVVKCGPKVDPAEHYLLEYLRVHCPTMRSPEPLGFFMLDHQPHLFMTRIKGVTLHSRWPSMSASQKSSVCSKLDVMLSDLRGIPWTPGVPLGSLISPHICKDTRHHVRTGGPIYNEAEFNDFLLRTPLKCDDHQIVLCHGDLNPKNIILLGYSGRK
ncbi:hypothetical protein M413DRAFT_445830 [Hebeloma cylindrosporum]|uniref:Aminoglycoside phosphotransferase domain-containing protein n=1 Tax=Hebeloma cylindrosporum TaxID=76867 RepID=A0A0C2YJC2_HEBCY|nr:hypothetical protein M413DRAFT_445830 [Hebeloma cylindrosporum h7]